MTNGTEHAIAIYQIEFCSDYTKFEHYYIDISGQTIEKRVTNGNPFKYLDEIPSGNLELHLSEAKAPSF